MSRFHDVLVIGAGAAGLTAAIRAAEAGRSTLLVEKNRKPGVKILMSGGTRCNVTNARGLRELRSLSGPVDPAYDPKLGRGARSIQAAFEPNGEFLGPALRAFSVEETVRLFEGEGVRLKVEGNGKIFPATDRAVDVLAALLARLGRAGAELRLESPVRELRSVEGGFEVALPNGPVTARRVIVATGGRSFPGCGTSGDGYDLARSFGHTIVPTRPSLVPLRVGEPWVAELAGLTIPDLNAGVREPGGKILDERREALLFAHFGLTGPAILDVSRTSARWSRPLPPELVLDFLPDERIEVLDERIQAAARRGRPSVVGLIPASIPRRLAAALVDSAGIPPGKTGPELSRDERRRLVGRIKSLALPITGDLGFAKAEVTSGGVSLDEVDPATMESRRRPGLYFVGEVLDLDGRIGGYNFQAAWSAGWLAGSAAARD